MRRTTLLLLALLLLAASAIAEEATQSESGRQALSAGTEAATAAPATNTSREADQPAATETAYPAPTDVQPTSWSNVKALWG